MDRHQKLELIQRSLGIRHKIKVHESMKSPDTHEELSLMLLAKWELEDELRAIEEILVEARGHNVHLKKQDVHAVLAPPKLSSKKKPKKG
jgi:HD-like signal output (HDOD) protein